jgi:hypothetical protein
VTWVDIIEVLVLVPIIDKMTKVLRVPSSFKQTIEKTPEKHRHQLLGNVDGEDDYVSLKVVDRSVF